MANEANAVGVGQQILVHLREKPPVGCTRRASCTQPRSVDGSIVADALLAWRCGHGGAYTAGRQSPIDRSPKEGGGDLTPSRWPFGERSAGFTGRLRRWSSYCSP